MIHCSRRLPWEAAPNAQAVLLDELRSQGAPLLDLTETSPTSAGLRYPGERVLAALADARTLDWRPAPRGHAAARQAIAARCAERGLDVDADDVLLTVSTSEAYALLFKLLCDAGDRVLVPQPSYPLFEHLAALEGVALEPYRLGFDGHFFLDLAAVQQALDRPGAPVRAVVAVSPNNPTGNFLTRAECAALQALARQRDLPLISDEVFADYALDDDPRRADSLASGSDAVCFALDGISKSLGLPQLKLGWIRLGGPAAERRRLMPRLELIADTYLSVGAPVQLALPALLPLRSAIGGAIRERCRRNLAALRQAAAGSACTVLPVGGGWSACVRLPATRSDERWALDLLEQRAVIVQPGYFYDFVEPPCVVVVSMLCGEAVFAEGAARLCRYASEA